jgi:hypothetical protein
MNHDRPGMGGMTELTKSAFSYAWAMSLLGAQQMMNLLNPAALAGMISGAAGDPATATPPAALGAPAGGSGAVGAMMTMLRPFNPVIWLDTGTEILKRLTMASGAPPQTEPVHMMPSVLDTGLAEPVSYGGGQFDADAGYGAEPSAPLPPPPAPSTGWGPMP